MTDELQISYNKEEEEEESPFLGQDFEVDEEKVQKVNKYKG